MSIINKLVETAIDEWEFFGRSTKKSDGSSTVGLREYDDGAWQRVADYWRFIGGPYKNLTGKDRGVPWSAAFISWCFNEAGAESDFPYSAGHAKYINTAIRNSDTGQITAPIYGHRLKGYELKVGDLIGYWRGKKPISFDTARKVGSYESHTDIVVEVSGKYAYSIGGNVMHSVTKREVKLGENGDLIDKSENWFVVIQNNL